MNLFGAAQDVLGAASDIFGGIQGAKGYKAASDAYTAAGKLAQENAQTTERSTAIQEAQSKRQVYGAISGEKAAMAGSGLASGGSNQYLLSSAEQQGGVTRSLIANQGLITERGYQAEAAADVGQAKQAQAQGQASKGGGFLGAIGGVVGAIASIF